MPVGTETPSHNTKKPFATNPALPTRTTTWAVRTSNWANMKTPSSTFKPPSVSNPITHSPKKTFEKPKRAWTREKPEKCAPNTSSSKPKPTLANCSNNSTQVPNLVLWRDSIPPTRHPGDKEATSAHFCPAHSCLDLNKPSKKSNPEKSAAQLELRRDITSSNASIKSHRQNCRCHQGDLSAYLPKPYFALLSRLSLERNDTSFGTVPANDKVNGDLPIDLLETFPHHKPSFHPFLIGL